MHAAGGLALGAGVGLLVFLGVEWYLTSRSSSSSAASSSTPVGVLGGVIEDVLGDTSVLASRSNTQGVAGGVGSAHIPQVAPINTLAPSSPKVAGAAPSVPTGASSAPKAAATSYFVSDIQHFNDHAAVFLLQSGPNGSSVIRKEVPNGNPLPSIGSTITGLGV